MLEIVEPATWGAALTVAIALGLCLRAGRTWRTARKRRAVLRAKLVALKDDIRRACEQLVADAPVAREAIRSLAAWSDRLPEHEQVIEDLLARARLLAAAAEAVSRAPGALQFISMRDLEEKLRFVKAASRRMQVIRDSFEARAEVLRCSEKAMRRAP